MISHRNPICKRRIAIKTLEESVSLRRNICKLFCPKEIAKKGPVVCVSFFIEVTESARRNEASTLTDIISNTPLWQYELKTQADGPLTITRDGGLIVAGNDQRLYSFETGSVGLNP